MKNIKKISIAALIIVTSLLSQTVVASSFPAVGVGVDNSASSSGGSQASSSSSGYIAPAATPVILGGDGLTPTTAYVSTDIDGGSPYHDTTTGVDYYLLASGNGFKVGDYVSDNGGIYILQASSKPGYLEAVLYSGTKNTGLGDGTAYFLLPVGNGNIILAALILTYGFYIFYRKKKKEKASVEVKKSYPLG